MYRTPSCSVFTDYRQPYVLISTDWNCRQRGILRNTSVRNYRQAAGFKRTGQSVISPVSFSFDKLLTCGGPASFPARDAVMEPRVHVPCHPLTVVCDCSRIDFEKRSILCSSNLPEIPTPFVGGPQIQITHSCLHIKDLFILKPPTNIVAYICGGLTGS